ncbi:MAG: PQQ-binding-like beta-propeller repeat protein [Micropruina sp.]|uniref:outer membrane protein assembly factor BamB family protein n=1 Tax=Micropruina sp. TaxID=2737536 RepID=UPI0039E57679
MIAVVVSVVIAAATSGRPVSAMDASTAMRYLPTDGRVLLENSDGTDTVTEYYSTYGMPIWQSGPAAMAVGGTLDELRSNTWVRISELTADARGRVELRHTQLLAARPSGLELRTIMTDAGFMSFAPEIPMLPAGVHDGQQWSAAGTVMVGSGYTPKAEQPYSATLRAATVRDGGCVAISSELTLGSVDTPIRDVSTWCPGRGIVATRSDDRSGMAVTRPPRWQSLSRVSADAKAALNRTWNFTRRDMNIPPLALYADVRPVVLPGPVIVYVNTPGGDLVARGWSDTGTDPRWHARPGGEVTSTLAIGKIVIAATTERTVVGYGDQGEFLWQAPLPDVSAVPIQRFGDLAVVATLDGTITAFEAETGRTAWTGQTPTEIRQPMVVDRDRDTLTVLDQAGTLVAFAPDGAVRHELAIVAPEAFTIAGDVAVVTTSTDSYVRGYRLADGEQLWRTHMIRSRHLSAIGDTALVGTADELTALRASDGVQVWAKPIDPVRVGVEGDRLLVADRTTLRLLDAAGTELGAYATPEKDMSTGAGPLLSVEAGELFWFFGSAAYRWEAR